jgi:hypothetical protein
MRSAALGVMALLAVTALVVACEDPEDDDTDDTEVCDNGEDDDGDTYVDCDDTDCADEPACAPPDEVCDNGVDDDGDGDTDCDDADCAGDPACAPPDEVCDNEVDDDGDGDADCDDTDCAADPACELPGEICDNDVDDDDDGFTDCDDAECAADPACAPPDEVCDNDIDDDDDGFTDCDDADCVAAPECVPADEDCVTAADDDGDGLVNCLDPDCDLDAACEELCNGVDDDGDGVTDEHPSDATMGDPCYEGPDGVAGVGQCEWGAIECFGGELLCLGWVAPFETELCDGLDNDCDGGPVDEEVASGCSTTIVPGVVNRIEFQTQVRDVDVQIDLDTTGSMGGELATLQDTLSTTIVPLVRDMLPTAEFGVSTFDDFPIDGFGSGSDTPFTLHQRVTSNVAAVQAAIDAIPGHNGEDTPESGIEALYQIATGAGTSWPRAATSDECGLTPGASAVTSALLDPVGDSDAYSISVLAGQTLAVNMFAGTRGSSLSDTYLRLYDQASGAQLAANDDYCGLDSYLTYVADADRDLVVTARAYGDGYAGWYVLQVTVDGAPYVADGDGCTGLEVGGEPFVAGVFDPALAVPLLEAATVYPRTDAAACEADCVALLADAGADAWAADFCFGVVASGTCGDGTVDPGEECDDGGTDPGDGCDGSCRSETAGVAAFDWTAGFDPGLGHGTVGGVGFRATALPVVVHITDAESHECGDYTSYDASIDAHCGAETFAELNAIGARVIVVRSGGISGPSLAYPEGMVNATDSIVPECAFDASPARASGVCVDGQCCTGVNGAGVSPDIDGNCPLVFDINGDGTGLDVGMVNAIDSLTQFVRYELSVDPRDDAGDAVNALCFIQSIGIIDHVGPTGTCVVTPTPIDTDGDGVDDTLVDATPRTRVTFEITAVNEDVNDVDGDGNTTEACAGSGTYGVWLDVIAEGGTVVATRRLEVAVP